jgi:uncharacterized membrane protein
LGYARDFPREFIRRERSENLPMGTERGADRLANFNDAVVAIAITLLVLPLTEEASSNTDPNIHTFMNGLWDEFFAFALSFVVIAGFWRGQHALLENLRGHTEPLVWSTLLWMFAIIFLPFPTALLSTAHGNDPIVYGLYVATMFVASLAMTLERIAINRHPELIEGELGPIYNPRSGLLILIILGVAFVLTITVPQIGLWPLLLLAVQKPLGDQLPWFRG